MSFGWTQCLDVKDCLHWSIGQFQFHEWLEIEWNQRCWLMHEKPISSKPMPAMMPTNQLQQQKTEFAIRSFKTLDAIVVAPLRWPRPKIDLRSYFICSNLWNQQFHKMRSWLIVMDLILIFLTHASCLRWGPSCAPRSSAQTHDRNRREIFENWNKE